MKFQVVIASLMVVACNGNTKAPTPERDDIQPAGATEKEPIKDAAATTQTGCANTSDCGECVTELQAWMRSFVDEGADQIVAEQFRLEPIKLLQPQVSTRLLPAPVIVIDENAVTFEGIQVGDPRAMVKVSHSEIPDLSDALVRRWHYDCQDAWGPAPKEVIVQLHSSTPWRVVRNVVATAEATHVDSVVFAFLKPTTVSKPSSSGIDAEIARIEERKPTDSFDLDAGSRVFAQAFKGCEAAQEGLLEPMQTGQSTRDAYLVDGLPKAIAACECNVDVEAVKALHWWWSGRLNHEDGSIYVGIRVPLTGRKKRTPIRSKHDAPWSQAHKQILASVGQDEAFFFTEPNNARESAQSKPRKAVGVCAQVCPNDLARDGKCRERETESEALASPPGGAFASITGSADFSSGLDDRDVYGGLLGDEVGEMADGWGDGVSGVYGTIGHDNGTRTGSATGKGGASGRKALPPRVRIGEVSATGDLDKNIIRRYIRRKLPRIRHCYEKQLLTEPNLEGAVVVDFEIAPKGAVREVTAHGLSKKIESCLAAAIRSIQFPKPKQGSSNVRYTFEFKPAGAPLPE